MTRNTLQPSRAAEDTPSDLTILHAARSDLRKFAPLYERYMPRIYRYCLRRTGSEPEAEDLTSQIFTSAMLNLEGFRGGVVAAWLFRIAHNTVINHLKAGPVLSELDEDLASDGPDPIERLIIREDAVIIRRLIEALPEAQQDMLLMRVVGALSAEEIGQIVGKRAGTVRVMLHRILKTLQVQYQGAILHD